MTHTQFVASLGAPLASARQSWGAIREADGVVFLLVWQDQIMRHGDSQLVRACTHEMHRRNSANFGYEERKEHVNLLRNGARCYLVMCLPKDAEVQTRQVRDFIKDDVFVGDAVIELDGESWIQIGRRISAAIVRPRP
jgi:hypothetical protein